jgi:hypothetical protein
MNARRNLKNFHLFMVKLYGENYRDVWAEDDAKTSEILERKVAHALAIEKIKANDNTPFLRRMKGGTVVIATAPQTPQEREEAWKEHADKYGSGIVGKRSPIKNPYLGFSYEPDTYAGIPDAPKFNPDDVDSHNIFMYLMTPQSFA